MSKKITKKEKENNKILGIILIVVFVLVAILVFKPKSKVDKNSFIELKSSPGVEDGFVFKNYGQVKKYLGKSIISKEDIKEYSFLYFSINYDKCVERKIEPKSYEIIDDKIVINVDYEETCNECFVESPVSKYYLLKIDKKNSELEYRFEYNNITNEECRNRKYVDEKPLIYLYPEKEMKVSIELGYPNKLTTTYPEYNKKWEVIAKPNGELKDSTGRTYYGLYWEGETTNKHKLDEGFVVSKKDTAKFLEEKLAILGLTEREANEFIIYWLPRLNENKYNLIRFETIDEINKDMPLKVSPKPDTVIRVFMDFKPLDKKIEIKEQKLTKQTRKGFTVVEWGGSLIK